MLTSIKVNISEITTPTGSHVTFAARGSPTLPREISTKPRPNTISEHMATAVTRIVGIWTVVVLSTAGVNGKGGRNQGLQKPLQEIQRQATIPLELLPQIARADASDEGSRNVKKYTRNG